MLSSPNDLEIINFGISVPKERWLLVPTYKSGRQYTVLDISLVFYPSVYLLLSSEQEA